MFDKTIYLYYYINMEKIVRQISMEGFENKDKNALLIPIFSDDFESQLNSIDFSLISKGNVCFTGNRPNSFPWKDKEDHKLCLLFKKRLKTLIQVLINNGYNHFITGMAMGFDIIASEIVLELKHEGKNLFLECVIPCLNQTKGWNNDYVLRYNYILNVADKVSYSSKYNYFDGCYQIRNRYMVDNAELVVGCLLTTSAGTKYTLNYAKKKNKNSLTIIQ